MLWLLLWSYFFIINNNTLAIKTVFVFAIIKCLFGFVESLSIFFFLFFLLLSCVGHFDIYFCIYCPFLVLFLLLFLSAMMVVVILVIIIGIGIVIVVSAFVLLIVVVAVEIVIVVLFLLNE